MFVFVSHLAVERREEDGAICTVRVSVSTKLRLVKLPHLFFQQTSNIFINARVKLIHFMH